MLSTHARHSPGLPLTDLPWRATQAGADEAPASARAGWPAGSPDCRPAATPEPADLRPGSGGCSTGPPSWTESWPAPAWTSHASVTPTLRIVRGSGTG